MLTKCCPVVTGQGNHVQLQHVWEDMRAVLLQWLAERQLPGGDVHMDKASYDQAVRTYQVLQEAANKGAEYLEQVQKVNTLLNSIS